MSGTSVLMRIVEAALAASLDRDLEPAARCLRVVGCEVSWRSEEEIHWHGGPGVPAGGLTAGGDPVTACHVLLFGSLGPAWAMNPVGRATWREVHRQWKERTKRAKQKMEGASDVGPQKVST